MEKTMKARVQHKHDIEANWLKATNFTPLASEIIVYDPDENYDYPRIKIGDGNTNINNLPFVTKDYAKISDIPTKPEDIGALPDSTVIPSKLSDLSEDTTHRLVTDTEKTTWNAKSNFSGNYNDLTNKPTIPSITGLASTTYVDDAVKNKVDKDGNKVLSTNDYTTAEKNKLANIAAGAEVNVNADWNATSGDAQILNKPTLGSMAAKSSVAKSDLASEVQTSLGKADSALQPGDISDWAKQTSKPSYTASEVGALPNTTVIPTKLADLTGDSTHRIVTDTEKSTWNAKAEASDIPTKVSQLTNDAGYIKSAPVTSVNDKTGVVMLTASDVGAATQDDIDRAVSKIVPEMVESVEDMVDPYKTYVLKSTGTIYKYGEVYTPPQNIYDASKAELGIRHSGNPGSITSAPTYFMTDYIPIDMTKVDPRLEITGNIDGKYQSGVYPHFQKIAFYNSSKTCIGSLYMLNIAGVSGVTTSQTLIYVDGKVSTVHIGICGTDAPDLTTTKVSYYDNIAFVRIEIEMGKTAVESDKTVIESIINPDSGKTDTTWYDTGLKWNTGSGSNDDIVVDLQLQVSQNTNDIAYANTRISALEKSSGTVTIPSVWESSVNKVIETIKSKQVGRNCVTFPFFSDNHQRNGYAGALIARVMKECHIPYCFYGGDSISSDYIDSEATMITQDSLFDAMMSPIPNGRLCRAVGNHDGFWNISKDKGDEYYYTRNQVYELFLREESIAQNKHFGDDGTYYYVDDISSRVRFIVLNTNGIRNASGVIEGGTFDSAQLAWFRGTALHFDESGWAVVLISHQPLSNHYHSNISNIDAVISMIRDYVNGDDENKADIVGCFSGHIHRDRIYTGIAANTTDDSVGEKLPFTQVTITSDANIDYDRLNGATGLDRNMSGDTSHAIDFITINKDTKIVNLTRLGMGVNRDYSYFEKIYYSITNNLTNVTNNNNITSIEKNKENPEKVGYNCVLTANTGYKIDSVTVIMGDTDITSDVYADGDIDIPDVTGNVVITAIAVAESNDPFAFTASNWTNSYSSGLTVNDDSIDLVKGQGGLPFVTCNHRFTRKAGTYSFSVKGNGVVQNNAVGVIVQTFDANGNEITDKSAYVPNHSYAYNNAYNGFTMNTYYGTFTFTLGNNVAYFIMKFAVGSIINVGETMRMSEFVLTEP